MSLYDDATLVMIPSGYKATKLYSVKPEDGTGDFVFSRSSIASRANADLMVQNMANDVPRLNYPTCPNLIIEPARTNQVTYPVSFDNTWWTQSGITIANDYDSPHADYPTSAFKFTESALDERHFIRRAGTFSTNTTDQYTITVYAKAAERTWLMLRNNSSNKAFFDLENGVIGSFHVSYTPRIKALANGWYRCSITYTGIGTTDRPVFGMAESDGEDTYLGDGTSGMYFFGSQFEDGSYPTSFIYEGAEGASINRAADDMTLSGLQTDILGATAGSWFFDMEDYDIAEYGTDRLFTLGGAGNSLNDSISFGNPGTTYEIRYKINNATALHIDFVGKPQKMVVAWDGTNIRVAADGAMVDTMTDVINASLLTDFFVNETVNMGLVNQMVMLDRALTNDEMIDITT